MTGLTMPGRSRSARFGLRQAWRVCHASTERAHGRQGRARGGLLEVCKVVDSSIVRRRAHTDCRGSDDDDRPRRVGARHCRDIKNASRPIFQPRSEWGGKCEKRGSCPVRCRNKNATRSGRSPSERIPCAQRTCPASTVTPFSEYTSRLARRQSSSTSRHIHDTFPPFAPQ